jgi:hypothetical protein
MDTKFDTTRNAQRFTLCIPAVVSMQNGGGALRYYRMQTRDISSNGAFFETGQQLAVGTRLQVNLFLKFGQGLRRQETHIQVIGTVVRTTPAGIAVRFGEDFQISPVLQ